MGCEDQRGKEPDLPGGSWERRAPGFDLPGVGSRKKEVDKEEKIGGNQGGKRTSCAR